MSKENLTFFNVFALVLSVSLLLVSLVVIARGYYAYGSAIALGASGWGFCGAAISRLNTKLFKET